MSKRRKRLYHAHIRANERYRRRMRMYGWGSLAEEALRLAARLWQHYRWSDTRGPSVRSFVWGDESVREAKGKKSNLAPGP